MVILFLTSDLWHLTSISARLTLLLYLNQQVTYTDFRFLASELYFNQVCFIVPIGYLGNTVFVVPS